MITLYFYKDSPEATQIKCKFATSPCFRIFLAERNSPIAKLHREGKHVLFTAWVDTGANNTRESIISKVINDNPLYPNHRVIRRDQVRDFLQDVELIRDNLSGGDRDDIGMTLESLSRFTILLANMRPIGYETRGIPCEQFIHGMFTARNAAQYSGDLSNLTAKYIEKGLHPFFAYLDNQIFSLNNRFLNSNTTNGYITTRYAGGSESENIDIYSFGSKSHQKLQDFFSGDVVMDTHPLDLGNYVFQTGGYFRDNMYGSQNQNIRCVDGLGSVRRRMASCLTLFEGDDSIFSTREVSFKTLRYMFNSLYRRKFFDIPDINLAIQERQTVYIDTRQLINIEGHERGLPIRTGLSLQGSVFKQDVVIGVDPSRVNQVLLEKMGWVNISVIFTQPIAELADSNIGRELKVSKNQCVTSNNYQHFGEYIKGVVVGSDWQGNLKVFMYEAAQKGFDNYSFDPFFGDSSAMSRSLNLQNSRAYQGINNVFGCSMVKDLTEGNIIWL